MSTQLLNEKLEECKHYDKDNRYMAAADLCSEMLKQATGVQFEEGMEKKICQAFMAHLSDKSVDVQSNAVKCIQKIASRIREKHLIMIVELMSEIVISGEKATRDIYSLAIRGIIGEISEENASTMIKAVYPKLVVGFGAGKSEEIAEECLDILGEIFKRFSGLLLKKDDLVRKDQLMQIISDQLSKTKASLRKKATNCIGSFSVILNIRQLQQMVKLVIDKLKARKSKEDLQTQLQAFAQVARNVGNKIAKEQIADIFPLLNVTAKQVVVDTKQSQDMDNEIAESCLFAIESLVKRAPKEVEPYIQSILELAQVAVVFDPNYDYSVLGDAPMEEDAGDGWSDDGMDVGGAGEEDDDSSWKVRRAAVKLIDSIVISRPDMLREVYQKYAKLLADRFKERDENVKINIFETFRTLIKSSILQEQHQSVETQLAMAPSLERQRSSVDEITKLVPYIVSELVKQLKESKSQRVKAGVMHTLAACSHALGQKLTGLFDQMLPEFEKILDDTSAYELILDTLVILRRLLKVGDQEQFIFQAAYQKIFNIIQKGISHEYSKVVSEALRVAGIFVNVLRDHGSGDISATYSSVVQPLYASIRTKLQKADIDQEIKECSIISMANFICICHKQLQPAQVSEVISIFNERLANDLTRDATLKSLTKIAGNAGARDRQLIAITNLASLTPRIFELLHKAQRTIHLNSLEALHTMVARYPAQFQGGSPAILKELMVFVNDNDMQVSALALKVASPTIVLGNPASAETQQFIAAANALTKSALIQGQSLLVDALLEFYKSTSSIGAVQDAAIGELYASISIKIQSSAMALARIAVHHKDANKKHSILNDLKTKIATPGNEVQASLALGELGKLLDLSTVANILNTVSALFKAPDESIRIAASISIGNISVGNPDFFLSKVFSLMDAAESSQKYLFLNTIREIIINNPKSLQQFIDKLLPLLIEQSKNQDEQIRSIVAENLGRLFIHYAVHMNSVLENSFRSPSALERATITKAFKYSSTKECNGHDLGYFTEYLIKMIGDADITVRRYALESLTAITHVHPEAVRNDSESMQANALQMTRIDPSLIKEVDLGPFKHKIDDGIPIRKAAYALIDTMVERLPERMNSPMVTEVAIRGLEDTAEECMIQSLTLIHRMAAFAPIFVITQIEALIDSFNKQFTKNIGIVGTNDKAKNVMRSIIRVVEQLHRTPEIEGVTKFADFFKEKILDIPAAKDIFQNIATTAQRAVYSEHY